IGFKDPIPCEDEDACGIGGKLRYGVPRIGGRALFASTAPAASTGSSSVAYLPNRRTRDVAVFVPRVIRRRARAPAWAGCGLARRLHGRLGRPDARRDAWCDLGRAHHAVAIPNLNLALDVFTHHHRTACGGVGALSLKLEEAVVIAHDPVI